MPRMARVVIPGAPHHVTHRGNDGEQVFVASCDQRKYLSLLKAHSKRFGLKVHAYCLMSNHVHLLVTPVDDESLSKVVGQTHAFYARFFNWRQARTGHLWQDRFFCCALNDTHVQAAWLYVERNPVRAGLVGQASDYVWSSARAHVLERDETGILDEALWREIFAGGGQAWKELLASNVCSEEETLIRKHTFSGIPLGMEVSGETRGKGTK